MLVPQLGLPSPTFWRLKADAVEQGTRVTPLLIHQTNEDRLQTDLDARQVSADRLLSGAQGSVTAAVVTANVA